MIRDDADAAGLSILSGAPMTLVARTVGLQREQDIDDGLARVGGTIAGHDFPELERLGVAAFLTPGVPLCEIVDVLRQDVGERTSA